MDENNNAPNDQGTEEPAEAWRRGRASIRGEGGKTGSWVEAVGGAPGSPAPRRLPDPADWGAPIELQPGVHYKSFPVPAGYVPGYPAPPVADSDHEGPGLVEYWRLLRRRKGTVLLIAALGLIGAA